jgi:hypothetical protein
MSYDWETKHGTVFFDPNKRQFIQVREEYFDINKDYKGYLKTGHFATFLNDAKNDMPMNQVTIHDVRNLINIEEVGLKNIKHVFYSPSDKGWVCEEKPRCPHCHRPY